MWMSVDGCPQKEWTKKVEKRVIHELIHIIHIFLWFKSGFWKGLGWNRRFVNCDKSINLEEKQEISLDK